jgi:hypothetical protein
VSARLVRRPHIGGRELALVPAKSVFINCPFDAKYTPLFEAVVFSCVCCGFMPRSALDSIESEPRLARITRAMFECRYSIHDLSRCKGEGNKNLARFNMPLELGMAMAHRYLRPREKHDWLVLIPERHKYLSFISDLAAYDPPTHDGSVPGVVRTVMAWLTVRPDVVASPSPEQVLSRLPAFVKAKRRLEKSWGGRPPWSYLIRAAIKAAKPLG